MAVNSFRRLCGERRRHLSASHPQPCVLSSPPLLSLSLCLSFKCLALSITFLLLLLSFKTLQLLLSFDTVHGFSEGLNQQHTFLHILNFFLFVLHLFRLTITFFHIHHTSLCQNATSQWDLKDKAEVTLCFASLERPMFPFQIHKLNLVPVKPKMIKPKRETFSLMPPLFKTTSNRWMQWRFVQMMLFP